MAAMRARRSGAGEPERDTSETTTGSVAPPPTSPATDAPHDVPTPATPTPRPSARAKAHPHLVTRLIAGAVVLAVVGGVSFMLRPKPITVDIALATTRVLHTTVDADAVTRVRSQFTITAPVGGLMQRLTLREGDAVRRGDVVATLSASPVLETDRRVALARLDAARASELQAEERVTVATQSLAQAVRDDRRARVLREAGAIADHDAELAQLTVTNRRSELRSAEALRRAAGDELAQVRAVVDVVFGRTSATTLVRAPAAGRVLGIPERSARVVTAGTPLLVLGDPASLEVVADVLSSDAASVRAGQAVELRSPGSTPLQGVVRLVEPSARTRISALGVEEQRLKVVIDLANGPVSLGDGYRLDAAIVTWEGRDVLTVPSGALLRTDVAWEVFAVRGGRAERVKVLIGHFGTDAAEVLGGLRRGDSVVVFAPDGLRQGARVKGT